MSRFSKLFSRIISAPDASPEKESNAIPIVGEGKLTTFDPIEGGDENNDLVIESDEDGEYDLRPTKKRKCTSKVWGSFKEVTLANGILKAECIYCRNRLSFNKARSTAHLDEHLTKCIQKKALEKPSEEDFKYDHPEFRELLSHMIILHELPFDFSESKLFNLLMESVYPKYKKISGVRAKKDCLAAYESEKEGLLNDLYDVDPVSVSLDLWKSGEDVSYMVVTCHYVDWESNLQRCILNFCEVPPPHSGLELSDVLHKCLVEWGIEEKVWTITVDNAEHNDVAVRILRDNLSRDLGLPLNGKFFHVRCFAHMVNLLVQDGLSAIKDVIFKVRESVKYVVASEKRITMFSEIAKQLELPSKKLVLDCCTRWNAICSMLSAALDFKDVFPKYQQRDTSNTLLPSDEEWERVRVVCSLLQRCNHATNLAPGTGYLTSNLFLMQFVCLKKILTSETNVGEDTCMIDMVTKMKARLDKYWRDSYLLMCVAAALDPRYKMEFVDFCCEDIHSKGEAVEYRNTVLETLRLLYNEYAEVDKANKPKTESCSNVDGGERHTLLARYHEYMKTKPRKSELDIYLEEEILVEKGNENDAVSWWGDNTLKFPILSKMAHDVLSIPITTVARESAFDAGSRVIDPQRASMGVDTMQVLLCGGDWLRARYEIKGKANEKVGIREISLP